MSLSPHRYCKKCRTCNTLTCSLQPEAASANAISCQESGIATSLGGGDAFTKDDSVDKTITQQLSPVNVDCPPTSRYVSSSILNSILSESSTPRSDGTSNYSDIQENPSLPKDSLLQYLQQEEGSQLAPTIGHIPLQDRSVVGQEKSPISGMTSASPVSGRSSSSHRSTAEMAPKERRRWVRPPLVGQAASNTDVKILSDEFGPPGEEDALDDSAIKITDSDAVDCSVGSSDMSGLKHELLKSSSSNESAYNLSVSKSIETGDSTDENVPQVSFQTTGDGEQEILSDSYIGGKASPSSSVASHKRLEWDSGADVGYQEYRNSADNTRNSILKLSAIERLALIQNTDKASRMRLDPEGTSGSVPSAANNPTPIFNTHPLTFHHFIGQPSAESTPTERASSLQNQRKVGANPIRISPIIIADFPKQALSSSKNSEEECKEEEDISPRQGSVPRTRSASLINLSTAVTDPSRYLYLYRSQSDPDISADAGTHTDDSLSLRFSPRKSFGKRRLDTHSLSSDSSNTLIHVPTKDSKNLSINVATDQVSNLDTKEPTTSTRPQGLADVLNAHRMPRIFPTSSKGYICSDNDHKQGLHHHYGILCSSCLVMPTDLTSLNPSKQAGNASGTRSSSALSSHSCSSHSAHSGSGDSRQLVRKKSSQKKILSQDRSSSASPPVDTMLKCSSAYVGKATSFEYLPGRIYESEQAAFESTKAQLGQNQHQSHLPSWSTSSGEFPPTMLNHQFHHLKHKQVVKSSSSDSDSENALWSSPRTVSGTLVRDIERGVSLLRGIVYKKNPPRQIVRRLVQKLVSSDYTDDLLERHLCRHNRCPFTGESIFGTEQLPSQSNKSEREPRIKLAPSGGSKRVHRGITSKEHFKTHPGTKTRVNSGSERSGTQYSAAADSSSLQSTSANESQKSVATDSTSNHATIRSNINPISETQPPNPASDQPSNPSSKGLPGPGSDQPFKTASERPSNLPAKRPFYPAPNQPSSNASPQSSDNVPNQSSSTDGSSAGKAAVVHIATAITKPATVDASTLTSQEMRAGVSYGTLSSVVSITPMTITVQSSPASSVQIGEVITAELPVAVESSKPTTISRETANASTMSKETANASTMSTETVNASTMSKETANVATMTSPPSRVTEPCSVGTQPAPSTSSEACISVGKEARNAKEERRNRKNVSSGRSEQQLQLINCDILHLKSLQKMLMKHPHIVISSPIEKAVPSNHPTSRKAKERDCQSPGDNFVHERRDRFHSRTQEDQAKKPPAIALKMIAPQLSPVDIRSPITSSSTLSSSSISERNSAPNLFACGAGDPATSSMEITDEGNRPYRPHKTEQTHKSSRKHRDPSPESEDSVTRAVTHAVSSRVKALRNLGQIEEAEVKIRVRMGQPSDAEGPLEKSASRQHLDAAPKISISQVRPTRTHKSAQESDDFDSKRAELDELIARQRAMDAEARKKLQLLNEMRERTTLVMKGAKVDYRDACTLTSVDTATNTTPMKRTTHVVSRSTQKESTVESSTESVPSRTSCPACRVRAASKKRPEDIPMCRHDPGFTAGQPRGRQRPPMAYFLKVEEEEVPVSMQTPSPRVPSLQVVTVKVSRPVRPPSSIGSSGSVSSGSSSSKHSPAHSPVRSRTAPGHLASSVPVFKSDMRSSPEFRKKSPRRQTKREVAASRSEPDLGRGDAGFAAEYSSDEQAAKETLQDCLTNNFPEYIAAAERRRQCIFEMSYLRRLRQESRKRLVQLDGDAWVTRQKQIHCQKPLTAPAKPASRPKTSARSMRLSSAMKYARTLEVEQKKLEMKKKEENRTNRLLKEIYAAKLRAKALRGETTLRSSVSVISSL